jgi:hypothetical protein
MVQYQKIPELFKNPKIGIALYESYYLDHFEAPHDDLDPVEDSETYSVSPLQNIQLLLWRQRALSDIHNDSHTFN